jgi:spermidine/putrescine-binding protein
MLSFICTHVLSGIVVAISTKEKSMRLVLLWIFLLFLPLSASADQRIVNVYAWTGEIPEFAVRQFERETGIKVNFST